MGDLTRNLSRSEFACECGCGFDTVDIELADVIQDSADHFASKDECNIRIKISGPNRCISHNEDVQRKYNPNYIAFSSTSQHIHARAADYKLFNRYTGEQIDPDRVADYINRKYHDRFGIGMYSNRTHIDTRTKGPARWDKR